MSKKETLNPKQAKFVKEYVKDGNQLRAATAAGYSSAKGTASKVANRPAVQSALSEVRSKVSSVAAYTLEAAMDQAEAAAQFAIETGNANAYVKAVELKAKLSGHMIERIQQQISPFTLRIRGVREKAVIDVSSETVADGITQEQEVFS